MTEADRHAALLVLADQLCPAVLDLPAASSVITAGATLERLFNAMPDARGPVGALLTHIHADGVGDLAELVRREPEGWTALTLVIATAYYADRAVDALLGGPGVKRRTLGEPDHLSALVAPVVARGPIWRHVE